MITIRALVEIVVQTVNEYMQRFSLNVVGLTFDSLNASQVLSHMYVIHSNGQCYSVESLPNFDKPIDILFLDSLPVAYYAPLALGVTNCPFTKLCAQLLHQNKPIFVLKTAQPSLNTSYQILLKTYYKLLVGYGVHFLDSPSLAQQSYTTHYHPCPVLSAQDVNVLAHGSKPPSTIKVAPSTIVTHLAKDQAKKLGIKIESR